MTTTATCFYHPGTSATRQCSQCSLPLCGDCVETVASQSVCRRCVSAIRARVAGQMGAAPSQPGPTPGGPSPSYQPPQYQPSQYQTGGVNPAPLAYGATSAAPDLDAKGLLLGGLFGALIGIVGAFVLAKVEFYTNFQVGLLNSLVGFGVGYGVLLGCKRGGLVPALLGGVLAFFAMILTEYFFFHDSLAKFVAERPDMAAAASTLSFAGHLSHITIGWLFIAIGVYGGAKTPLRAGR